MFLFVQRNTITDQLDKIIVFLRPQFAAGSTNYTKVFYLGLESVLNDFIFGIYEWLEIKSLLFDFPLNVIFLPGQSVNIILTLQRVEIFRRFQSWLSLLLKVIVRHGHKCTSSNLLDHGGFQMQVDPAVVKLFSIIV